MLSLLLVSALATAVFALDSTTGDNEFKVQVVYETKDPITEGPFTVKEGENYTLVVKTIDGYTFDKIQIDGKYELVSQDGNTYVIKPLEDIVIHVLFKDTPVTPKPSDDGGKSPATGVNPMMIALIAVVAVAGVVVSTRKLIKTR